MAIDTIIQPYWLLDVLDMVFICFHAWSSNNMIENTPFSATDVQFSGHIGDLNGTLASILGSFPMKLISQYSLT